MLELLFILCFALSLLLLSADNLYKQFGPRSGTALFDALIVFLNFFLKKLSLKKPSK